MPTIDNKMQTGEESVCLQIKEELQSLSAVVIWPKVSVTDFTLTQ